MQCVRQYQNLSNYLKERLNSYWSGDITTVRSRFVETTRGDEQWNMFGHWAETRGTTADKAVYRMANLARSANDNKFLTYSTKLMAATDDAFGYILGRARLREKAMFKARMMLMLEILQTLMLNFYVSMKMNLHQLCLMQKVI